MSGSDCPRRIMQISDAPRAPFMRPMGRGRLKYGCGIAQCGACRAPPGPLAPGSISRTIPHGLPRGDLAQPPEAGTCGLLDSRRGNRRVPGRRRRSDAGSHGRRGGLRRLPRFRRALAWDRVGVADFVLWEGMFSEQKSVPKKYLEQKFSFWSHSSAG